MKELLLCFSMFIFVFSFYSCENDDEKDENCQEWNRGKLISFTEYSFDNNDPSYIVYHEEYTYDSQGREIGYKLVCDEKLVRSYDDYYYNGNELTYTTYIHIPYNGSVYPDEKHKIVFYRDLWNREKIISKTIFSENNTTPKSYEEYTYDSQGREAGYKLFRDGKLLNVYDNYSYNGNELIYRIILYTSEPEYSYNDKIVFYGDLWNRSKILSNTVYQLYNTYDSQGREIGRKSYSKNELVYVCDDYSYNGNELIYTKYIYSKGLITGTKKIKIVFYEKPKSH